MGQRQKTPASVGASQYKYRDKDECEENEDFHVFTPKAWPPRRQGHQVEEPSVSGRCDLCGCHLTIYLGHATGEIGGIKVNLARLQARAGATS